MKQPCAKVKYYDKLGAQIALAVSPGKRSGWHYEKRIYWCNECKAYHLTSKR